jgi:dsDNA-binding SOS-regulon protein
MSETYEITKTRPIRVLESRREACVRWLAENRDAIETAEKTIRDKQELMIELVAEIDEIDATLNDLYRIQNRKEQEAEGMTHAGA